MTFIQQPSIQQLPPTPFELADAGVALPPALTPAPAPAAAVKPALQPNATLLAREDVTDSMAAFTVALDEPFEKFRPGQYVSLGVVGEAGLVQRPYSIVSLDGDRDRVELFIRRVPDGALSGRLWRLPIGARVRVGQPKGLFVLDEADSRPRLFIGTGTGLAPLLAMLEAIMERGDGATSVLIHGVSYRDELAYGYRIASWMATGLPLVYRPTLSRPDDPRNDGWRGFTGRADTAISQLLDEMPFLREGVAYMCGNGSMVDTCTKLLVESGLAPQDVRAEQFHAPTAAPASSAVS